MKRLLVGLILAGDKLQGTIPVFGQRQVVVAASLARTVQKYDQGITLGRRISRRHEKSIRQIQRLDAGPGDGLRLKVRSGRTE